MALFALHPWIRVAVDILVGCWIGVPFGMMIALTFAGRRIKQLECANNLLRMKLRTSEKPARANGTTGMGPSLVTSAATRRAVSAPLRAVGGR
ncbi:MAG TPA: hypothetical protein VHX60_06105 [Acidobacteriaceae bacterium]|jgi:hypothetical protein|nr:hypothetical protein [Acidobacteriaceae bacterium]